MIVDATRINLQEFLVINRNRSVLPQPSQLPCDSTSLSQNDWNRWATEILKVKWLQQFDQSTRLLKWTVHFHSEFLRTSPAARRNTLFPVVAELPKASLNSQMISCKLSVRAIRAIFGCLLLHSHIKSNFLLLRSLAICISPKSTISCLIGCFF